MIDSPKISVALCTYNGEKYLPEQLDSIISQSFPPYEIIIVDDGSSDDTLSVLKQYSMKYQNIHVFCNEERLGFIGNFSLAVSKTHGDYVALADQDDIWTNNHLEALLHGIGHNAICVGDAIMIDSEGKETGERYSDIKKNYFIPTNSVSKAYRIVYNLNPYQGASMLIDRNWVETYLPIPEEAGFHDTFLAGCASLTKGLAVIPDIINRYRMHEGQVTTTWKISVYKELRHRRHRICYPSKPFFIHQVLDKNPELSSDAVSFINEFKQVLDLNNQNKRFKALRILNRHYKEIYSTTSYKYIMLRSLHYLIAGSDPIPF